MAEKKKKCTPQQESEVEVEKTENTTEQPSVADNELKMLKTELNNTKDMLLRTAAEYDNFKKRTEREKAQLTDFVKANVIKNLIPVADSIGLSAMCDTSSPDYLKGLEIIVKQLCETLDKLGLKEIEAKGQPFDPNLHEAVMHTQDENLGENVVAEVLQPGYMLGDMVLRPSMVNVAN